MYGHWIYLLFSSHTMRNSTFLKIVTGYGNYYCLQIYQNLSCSWTSSVIILSPCLSSCQISCLALLLMNYFHIIVIASFWTYLFPQLFMHRFQKCLPHRRLLISCTLKLARRNLQRKSCLIDSFSIPSELIKRLFKISFVAF